MNESTGIQLKLPCLPTGPKRPRLGSRRSQHPEALPMNHQGDDGNLRCAGTIHEIKTERKLLVLLSDRKHEQFRPQTSTLSPSRPSEHECASRELTSPDSTWSSCSRFIIVSRTVCALYLLRDCWCCARASPISRRVCGSHRTRRELSKGSSRDSTTCDMKPAAQRNWPRRLGRLDVYRSESWDVWDENWIVEIGDR